MTTTHIPLNALLWGLGVLITIIGFFIVRYLDRATKKQDELTTAVNSLQISITGLNAVILSIQDHNSDFGRNCEKKHSHVDRKVSEIASKQEMLEKEVLEHDFKLNLTT